MRDIRLFEELGQEGRGTVGEIFRSMIRGHLRWFICEAMVLEVEELCGAKHRPKGGEAYRAGSSPGRVRIGGAHAEVRRPRVRRRKADGNSEEVWLETYTAASDPFELEASILAALKAGVSTREVRDVVPDGPGTSRSSVSRLWCEPQPLLLDKNEEGKQKPGKIIYIKTFSASYFTLHSSFTRRLLTNQRNGRSGGDLCGNLPEKSNFVKKEEYQILRIDLQDRQ